MAKVSFIPVEHDPWADLPKGELELRQGPMSWTDYLPFVKEAVKMYGKEKLGEMLGAVTAPGDALAGRLDPGTPEGLKRVQALANLAMSGPAKPSGAIGAGWQFPKAVPKAETYLHPASEPFTSHPATYGMSEPEVQAAGELLEMLKTFPDKYNSPKEAVNLVESWAEPDELPYFESAAKKLEEWAGPYGFKFQEEPKVAAEPPLPTPAPAPVYTPPQITPIEEALYPINWADLHSTLRRPGQEASGEYAQTLRRAEALGFNTNFPLYHGAFEPKLQTPATPHEGLWGPKAESYHAFGDPRAVKDFERGIFATDAPEIAAQYSGGGDAVNAQGQTLPLFANPKSVLAVDWSSIAGQPSYNSSTMHRLIEAAHKREADALVVQGMGDVGGLQNQYVFLRPNVLRSQFAMFDPKKVDSPNLLHSGGHPFPLLVPVDHDPFAEPNQ